MKDHIDNLIDQAIEAYGDSLDEDDLIAEVMYQLELVFIKDEEDDDGYYETLVFDKWEIKQFEDFVGGLGNRDDNEAIRGVLQEDFHLDQFWFEPAGLPRGGARIE